MWPLVKQSTGDGNVTGLWYLGDFTRYIVLDAERDDRFHGEFDQRPDLCRPWKVSAFGPAYITPSIFMILTPKCVIAHLKHTSPFYPRLNSTVVTQKQISMSK